MHRVTPKQAVGIVAARYTAALEAREPSVQDAVSSHLGLFEPGSYPLAPRDWGPIDRPVKRDARIRVVPTMTSTLLRLAPESVAGRGFVSMVPHVAIADNFDRLGIARLGPPIPLTVEGVNGNRIGSLLIAHLTNHWRAVSVAGVIRPVETQVHGNEAAFSVDDVVFASLSRARRHRAFARKLHWRTSWGAGTPEQIGQLSTTATDLGRSRPILGWLDAKSMGSAGFAAFEDRGRRDR